MKKLFLLSLLALLFSCEAALDETSVPTDTIGASLDTTRTGLDTTAGTSSPDGVSIDYFKNIPSLPAADAKINSMLSNGKWVVVDYEVRNLDYVALPHSTPKSIYKQNLYGLKDFSMVMNADQTMQLKKSRVADCSRRLFQVNRMKSNPVLTLVCEENKTEITFEILGMNEEFLYLKEERGMYPFEVRYLMKKE